jgi:hypothetical protein
MFQEKYLQESIKRLIFIRRLFQINKKNLRLLNRKWIILKRNENDQ